MADYNICEGCALFGRCDGRCGDTMSDYYENERENDERDEYEKAEEWHRKMIAQLAAEYDD